MPGGLVESGSAIAQVDFWTCDLVAVSHRLHVFGLAGLVYEVTWTRLLTLYIGHTTAAASAVVAAFLGGLAIGAAVGGRIASTQSPRRCLQAYVGLEIAVALLRCCCRSSCAGLGRCLRWAYQDGAGGALFPMVRILSCIVMVMLPALALGATFPMAIRWFARGSTEPARQSSTLYFVNTIGAAAGSLLAGLRADSVDRHERNDLRRDGGHGDRGPVGLGGVGGRVPRTRLSRLARPPERSRLRCAAAASMRPGWRS